MIIYPITNKQKLTVLNMRPTTPAMLQFMHFCESNFRKLLGKKARSISLGESENGKPFIPGLDLPFSISRTRNLFAFVVGHGNQFLGVDIEQIKPEIDFTNISRNYFSDKEQQLIFSFKNPDDQKRTFF